MKRSLILIFCFAIATAFTASASNTSDTTAVTTTAPTPSFTYYDSVYCGATVTGNSISPNGAQANGDCIIRLLAQTNVRNLELNSNVDFMLTRNLVFGAFASGDNYRRAFVTVTLNGCGLKDVSRSWSTNPPGGALDNPGSAQIHFEWAGLRCTKDSALEIQYSMNIAHVGQEQQNRGGDYLTLRSANMIPNSPFVADSAAAPLANGFVSLALLALITIALH